jgi:hypothetical protein
MPISSAASGNLRISLNSAIFWLADGSTSTRAYAMTDDGSTSCG